MIKKILILICFIPLNIFAQKSIYIKDLDTKKTLPFATIKFLGKDAGLYTNENGEISLSKITSDSIEVSYLGYFSLKLEKLKIKDTIFLKQNFEVLSEIKIVSGKSTKKVIGFLNKKKPLSWHIRPKTELVTLIKTKKTYEKTYIEKIHIPIGKKRIRFIDKKYKETYPNFNNVFRVNLYSNLNGKPGKMLFRYPILIECTQKTDEIIQIDIADDFIKYPNNGVFIGVEMIGELDNDRNVISKNIGPILPSFKFTKKKKKNVFSTSYIKTIFLGNNWVDIEKNNEFSQVSEYNMAISLTLGIYGK